MFTHEAGYYTNMTTNIFNVTQNVHVAGKSASVVEYFPILVAEMSLSIFCLLLLIGIYTFLGEYRSVAGKIVYSLSGCLIVAYAMLIVDLSRRGHINGLPCQIISFTIHITFIATFFWTNVMAYDIMKTIASITPNLQHSARYWKYSIYAWGMTLLCSIPAFVIDNTDSVPNRYKPNFGKTRCWLNNTEAFILYFNGPVAVILLTNCFLFIVTSVTISKVKNAVLLSRAKPHKQRFRLYIKLVLVMGLVWITEFIPWATGIYKLYALAGILNCLHGLYMFLIFACKARNLSRIRNAFLGCTSPGKKSGKKSPSLATLSTVTSSVNRSRQQGDMNTKEQDN